jgi:hypothetical protein
VAGDLEEGMIPQQGLVLGLLFVQQVGYEEEGGRHFEGFVDLDDAANARQAIGALGVVCGNVHRHGVSSRAIRSFLERVYRGHRAV